MVQSTGQPPLICHCLIGPPGAGKSTLAQQWVARLPQHKWVSTDHIRQDLFGDATFQGDWPEVEAEVIRQIKATIATGTPVIYDATNAKRAWRLSLMQKLANDSTQWMAWWLKTSLKQCQAQNKQRDRQVEEPVIEEMYAAIKAMPPICAEGFASVNAVPLQDKQFDFEAIEQKIETLPQSLLQRQRRQGKCRLHPYSSLLAFEQLLYLLATLLEYPGAGDLQQQDPSLLQQALQLETLPHFENPIDELSALMRCQHGQIYADPNAIAQNIRWLQSNHIVNAPYRNQPIELPVIYSSPKFPLHRYSDREPFIRLIGILRFIAYHPFIYSPEQGSLKTLISAMKAQGMEAADYIDSVRRDIGEVLKPYGLMPKSSQIHGYFVGTAILSQIDLLKVFNSLMGQIQYLEDPVLLSTYAIFRERLGFLQVEDIPPTSIRTVLQQPIVDIQHLSPDTRSLAAPGNAERLEDAILQSQVLTLSRRRSTGRFRDEEETTFQILPLQIAFHSIAWYLGYERLEDGLLRYERLDRLEIVQVGNFTRPKTVQTRARRNLKRLYEASYGLYLGDSAIDQQKLLSSDPSQRSEIELVCELWFSDKIFRFISEGTQRFPCQMSPRLTGAAMTESEKKSIFVLPRTDNPTLPNRLQARLPRWVLTHDVDFKRWILGFGGNARVITPEFLANDIQAAGREILQVYVDCRESNPI